MSVPTLNDRGGGPVCGAKRPSAARAARSCLVEFPFLLRMAGYGKMCYAFFLQSRDEPSII